MMRLKAADPLVERSSTLGEGPYWDQTHQRLLWLDIDEQILCSYSPETGGSDCHRLDAPASFVAPTHDGGLVIAGGGSVRLADKDGRQARSLARLPIGPDERSNDGVCDRNGHLWIGTATSTHRDARLFRVDQDGGVATCRTGLSLSNGIEWESSGRFGYHVDTHERRIDRLTVDSHGRLVDAAEFARTEYLPDGLTIDSEGGVWVAFWDGGSVHRLAPDGSVDLVVSVDAGRVTSCAFGPPGSTILYITTARKGMSPEQLTSYPLSGSLFAVDVGVGGSHANTFGDL